MENNINKKSVKFQGDMLNFYDFIQVFVFTTNHHLNGIILHLIAVSHTRGYLYIYIDIVASILTKTHGLCIAVITDDENRNGSKRKKRIGHNISTIISFRLVYHSSALEQLFHMMAPNQRFSQRLRKPLSRPYLRS